MIVAVVPLVAAQRHSTPNAPPPLRNWTHRSSALRGNRFSNGVTPRPRLVFPVLGMGTRYRKKTHCGWRPQQANRLSVSTSHFTFGTMTFLWSTGDVSTKLLERLAKYMASRQGRSLALALKMTRRRKAPASVEPERYSVRIVTKLFGRGLVRQPSPGQASGLGFNSLAMASSATTCPVSCRY